MIGSSTIYSNKIIDARFNNDEVWGSTLGHAIFARTEHRNNPYAIAHERRHVQQFTSRVSLADQDPGTPQVSTGWGIFTFFGGRQRNILYENRSLERDAWAHTYDGTNWGDAGFLW